MSTIFGIHKNGVVIEVDDAGYIPNNISSDDFIHVAFRGNSGRMWFTNDVAKFLDPKIKVYAIDNSAQGVFTIGDIINEIGE